MALTEIQQARLQVSRQVRVYRRSAQHWAKLNNRLAQAQAGANLQLFRAALEKLNLETPPTPEESAEIDALLDQEEADQRQPKPKPAPAAKPAVVVAKPPAPGVKGAIGG